jgi:hypothetical protein
MPTVRRPEPSEPSGRGLRIVQELADSFGVRELRGTPGKTVWFVVGLEESRGLVSGAQPATRELAQPQTRPGAGGGGGGSRLRSGRPSDATVSPEARSRRARRRRADWLLRLP